MHFEDAAPGQAVAGFARDVTLTDLVMYAGATWDFHRFHYDPAFVRARGFPAPFADGQMVGALLAKQLVDWAGPDAFVRRLRYRLRAMIFAGERVTGTGAVTATRVEEGRPLVECSLTLRKDDGTVVVSDALGVVELPRRRTEGTP